jgi:hypothetical protein
MPKAAPTLADLQRDADRQRGVVEKETGKLARAEARVRKRLEEEMAKYPGTGRAPRPARARASAASPASAANGSASGASGATSKARGREASKAGGRGAGRRPRQAPIEEAPIIKAVRAAKGPIGSIEIRKRAGLQQRDGKAVGKRLKKMVEAGLLTKAGERDKTTYSLGPKA